MKIFISCSFDPSTRSILELIKSVMRMYQIEVFISDEAEAKPLGELIKGHVRGSDALLAILTKRKSVFVQNEIGIAYGSNIPVFAIVQRDVEVEGILQHISTYDTFNAEDPTSIVNAVSNIARKIIASKPAEEKGTIYKLFKNKRERIIFQLGTHGAAHQLFILLLVNDISPVFYDFYKRYHEREFQRLEDELKCIE